MSQPESVPQRKFSESKLVAFLKEIYGIWISERPTQFAAALAYYAIFSFVPVIYITFTITELVIERLSVAETFYTRIANLLGAEIAQALQEAVTGLAEKTAGDSLTELDIVDRGLTRLPAAYRAKHPRRPRRVFAPGRR